MIGKTLSNYTVTGVLGSGGMGTVYLATDKRLHRTVALKVLPADLAADPERRRRFTVEARSASALKHPNVAHIYDVGEADGVSFIVMEHIEGESLSARIATRRVTIPEAVDIARQMADALADAHARQITHRDIKPANVMLTGRDQVKVLDFGLARLSDDPDFNADSLAKTLSKAPAASEGMTQVGQLLGTVPYMSPEQASGEPVGPPSDVFSLGVVLYEMLAGGRPFAGRTPQETLALIITGGSADVSTRNQAVPALLAGIVRKCLELNPADRYPTARELFEALDAAGTGPAVRPGAKSVADSSGGRDDELSGIESVAVLPFDNGSKDEEAEYLCEGIAENIIGTLTRLPDLRVISRHATFALRDEPRDVRALGERLDVDALLLGSLRTRKGRLIVNAELVGVPDGRRLWGERYDRPLDEAADVEYDVADNIVGQLKEALSSDDAVRLVRKDVDPQAYHLCLKGRSLLVGTATEMKKAAEYLLESADRDPAYALPHAALVESYMGQAYHHIMDSQEARKLARAAARRAVQLDPDLPEAQTALGIVSYVFEWDWEGAEEAFRRAIEMGPGRDMPHYEYAEFLTSVDRLPEALEMSEKARRLDPVSPQPTHLRAYVYMLMGEYGRAIDEFNAAIELHPNWIWGHIKLGGSYSRAGDHRKALAEADIADAAMAGGGTPLARSWVARIRGVAGQQDRAREVLAKMQDTSDVQIEPLARGYIYSSLGDLEGVLTSVEAAYTQRSALCAAMKAFSRLEPHLHLDNEPRFQSVIQKMGMPDS